MAMTPFRKNGRYTRRAYARLSTRNLQFKIFTVMLQTGREEIRGGNESNASQLPTEDDVAGIAARSGCDSNRVRRSYGTERACQLFLASPVCRPYCARDSTVLRTSGFTFRLVSSPRRTGRGAISRENSEMRARFGD